MQYFSARFVTKIDSNNNNAFGSVDGGGRLGNVVDGALVQYFKANGSSLCGAKGGFPLPKKLLSVALQPSYPGASGDVFPFYQSRGDAGVVIEGFGAGNVGAQLAKGLVAFANDTSFRFVVARKPQSGVTVADYGCKGCLGTLVELGAVQALNLDAFQARIVLMLALTQRRGMSTAALQGVYRGISFPAEA